MKFLNYLFLIAIILLIIIYLYIDNSYIILPEHIKLKTINDISSNYYSENINKLALTIQNRAKISANKAFEHSLWILTWSERYNVDYRLVYALARSEVNNFNVDFHREKDGYGVMQVLLSTAKWFDGGIEAGVLKRPETNYNFGIRFFRYCLNINNNDLSKAVLQYKRWEHSNDTLDRAKLKSYYKYLLEIMSKEEIEGLNTLTTDK